VHTKNLIGGNAGKEKKKKPGRGNEFRKTEEMVSFRLPVDTNGKSILELNPSKRLAR